MGDRKNTATSWAGPFIGLPFSGSTGQESAIVALHSSVADLLGYLVQLFAASRTTVVSFKHLLYMDKIGMLVY